MFSDLNANQLNGTIPDSIGNFFALQDLYVWLQFHHSYQQLLFSLLLTTFFTIFSSTNLISSELASNQLSGTIPDSIRNLINLQYMYAPIIPSFISTTLIFSRPSSKTHHSLFCKPHVQLFAFQPAEWNHPWFDREPYQPSEPVCVTIIPSFSFINLILTSFLLLLHI